MNLRTDAIERLESIRNLSLNELALDYGISTESNKGWVGQVLDRVIGTEGINAQAPDGDDYELKAVVGKEVDGRFVASQTIAVTMLSPERLINETFEDSSLWHKLSRLLLVGYTREPRIVNVTAFDVTNEEMIDEIRTFWLSMQETVKNGMLPSYSSKGTSQFYIQARTKGAKGGKSICPITGLAYRPRAFYATKRFVDKAFA